MKRKQRMQKKWNALWVAALAGTVLAVVAMAASAGEPLPIIPGAHGFGMDTPAGSGRHLDVPKTRVIKVTNLNPSGQGSLRAALEVEGPRVVVFEVSGNIDFTPVGGLSIKHPYVTVAGQTAPSPGITLKGCQLIVRGSDVLLQHIRVRVGDLLDPSRPVRNAKSGWTQYSERVVGCRACRNSAGCRGHGRICGGASADHPGGRGLWHGDASRQRTASRCAEDQGHQGDESERFRPGVAQGVKGGAKV